MRQKLKQLLGILLSLALVLGLMPGMSLTAYAATDTYTNLMNDKTVVKFNNHEWYIIADDSTATGGTVTLLAAGILFGSQKFHNSSNAYSGSDVKSKLDELTAEGGDFAGVKDAIVDTELTDVGVTGAKLYLLSKSEAELLSTDVLKGAGYYWWLRSPGDGGTAAYVDGSNGTVQFCNVKGKSGGRPALKLNLSSVIFSSESNSFSLKYDVTITAGEHMTTTGNASQTGLSGAMTDVVYTAADGYYFPTNYSVAAVNGISVTRNSYTQITVSGTPTANAAITLTAPTAKEAQTAPAANDITVTKASSNTATDGVISGVTSAMEYQIDGASTWTAVGENQTEITGLAPGTYKVRYAGTADKNASDATSVVVGVKEDQTAPAANDITVTKASSNTATDGKISGVTSAMEYQLDGASEWTAVGENQTEITGLAPGTYKVRYAGTADKNASDATSVVVGVKEAQTAPAANDITVTKASSNTATDGKISGVTSAMEYQLDGASEWTAVGENQTEITGLAAGTYKVRYAGTADKNASDATSVVVGVKEAQTAPAANDITVTKATSSSATDGVISGVTSAMEYQFDGASEWTAVGENQTEITGLAAGTYKVRYAGTADKNASSATTVVVGVKVAPTVTAPTAKTLTYNGQAQELVTAGSTEDGTLYYAVTTENTAPTDNLYTTSIPLKTDAGTYYVWYKVVGDDNHTDTEAACVTVTITPDETAHQHTFGTEAPRWSWSFVDGKCYANATYTCTCGETEEVSATVDNGADNGNHTTTYTATDKYGNTDTYSCVSTYDVTYNSVTKSYKYGDTCKLTSDVVSDWKVNDKLRAEGTRTFYFPVSGDADVTATPSAKDQQSGLISVVSAQGDINSLTFVVSWSLPEGAQVKSTMIYRCKDNDGAITTADALLAASNLRSYNMKLNVRNGQFTYKASNLTPGTRQTIMAQVVYTYNGKTYTINTAGSGGLLSLAIGTSIIVG